MYQTAPFGEVVTRFPMQPIASVRLWHDLHGPRQLEWTAILHSQMKYILRADFWSDLRTCTHVFCCGTL